jgi:anti-anti-sigma factor
LAYCAAEIAEKGNILPKKLQEHCPTEPAFQIASETDESQVTIFVKGDVVGPEIVRVCKAIEAYRNSLYDRVVVDLTSVNYIDSAGIGALIYSKKILEKNKKNISFLTSRAVENILESCNLHRVFTIIENVA